MRHDVVILGAGPAGSSLAAVLGELGWDVVLLERRHFPHHKVCGEFLSPESQVSLRAMGLHQLIEALEPVSIRQAKLVSRAGVAVQVALPGCAWGLSRFSLDATLAAAAVKRGVDLRTGVTATHVSQAAGGVEVTLRSRQRVETVEARAVVAACGRYSLPGLPPRLKLSQPPAHKIDEAAPRSSRGHQSESYIGVKCHYEGVTMPAQVELFFFPGGYAGVNPIEGGRVNVCLLATQAAFARAGRNVSAMLQMAAHLNPALGGWLSAGQALPETEVAVAPVDTKRPASPWDGMACLGDTVVMIPPLCGDGIAMALRSAEICAPLAHDFLRGRRSLADWQSAYQANWHVEFDKPVRVGRWLQTILSKPLLADAFFGLSRLVPPLAAGLVQATRGPRPS